MSSSSESHLNVYVRPPHTSSWVLFSCLDLKPFLSRCNWARALGHQWVKTPNKQVSAPVVPLVWSWRWSPRAAVSASRGSLWEKQIPGLYHRLVEFSSGDGTRQCVLKCVTWCTLQCENHCTCTHQGGWGRWRSYFPPWGWSELLHCDGINIAIDLFSFFQGHEKNLKYWLTDTNL